MRCLALILPSLLASLSFAFDDTVARDTPGRTFRIEGESRVRFEHLDGQFRAGIRGSDRVLAMRTLVLGELETGNLRWGAELQDSRTYLGDRGTPLTNGIVNPADLLQAYLRYDRTTDVLRRSLTLGRMTLHIGSGRQVERVDFANVILNYTGVHFRQDHADGRELQVFLTAPVDRRPKDLDSLLDNAWERNREAFGRRFWGVHYRHLEPFGTRALAVWGELFLYGLNEHDRNGQPTPNRRYLTPGIRLYREPVPGQWDVDIEGSYRFGSRRATDDPLDRNDLDVRARTLHAALGYTFTDPWNTRVALDFDYASGDRSPTDGRFDQYERLFGARRTDLGHTGIYGPFTPANINAPGARVEIRPNPRLDARLTWKAPSLAAARDSWVVARLRDPQGTSGRFLGHAVDGRIRYWLLPDQLRAEIGGSALFRRGFAKRVTDGPGDGTSSYGYVQVTLQF